MPAQDGEEDSILSLFVSVRAVGGMKEEDGARAGDPGFFELMKPPGLTTLCYERREYEGDGRVFVGWGGAPGHSAFCTATVVSKD